MVDNIPPTNSEPRPAYQPMGSRPEFDIGRVLGRGFSALRDNWLAFLKPAMLFVGLPMFIVGFLPLALGMTGGLDIESGDIGGGWIAGSLLVTFASLFIALVGGVILQGALTYACIKSFNNETPDMQQSLSIGLKLFWPLIGLGILMGLGIMFGLMLLIVPGIILLVMWSVAAPVLIMERLGVTESFTRSSDLTRGYRWWVFLFLIIIMVIGAIIGAIFGVIPELITPAAEVMMNGATPTYVMIVAVTGALTQVFSIMINAATASSLYYELRDLKEGISVEALASVFD